MNERKVYIETLEPLTTHIVLGPDGGTLCSQVAQARRWLAELLRVVKIISNPIVIPRLPALPLVKDAGEFHPAYGDVLGP